MNHPGPFETRECWNVCYPYRVCRSRKIESNSSTIMNRLLMMTLSSPETLSSAQSWSQSAFTRLISPLTEVLSKLATAIWMTGWISYPL